MCTGVCMRMGLLSIVASLCTLPYSMHCLCVFVHTDHDLSFRVIVVKLHGVLLH